MHNDMNSGFIVDNMEISISKIKYFLNTFERVGASKKDAIQNACIKQLIRKMYFY